MVVQIKDTLREMLFFLIKLIQFIPDLKVEEKRLKDKT